VCVFDKRQKMVNKPAHTKTKKRTTSPKIAPTGAQFDEKRYRQLRPYGAERKKFCMRTVTKNQITMRRFITER